MYEQLSVQLTALIQTNLTQSENCALPGYYTASSGNFLPMVQDNLSVPSSRVKNPKNPRNYYFSLSNRPDEHSSLLHGGSLKSLHRFF